MSESDIKPVSTKPRTFTFRKPGLLECKTRTVATAPETGPETTNRTDFNSIDSALLRPNHRLNVLRVQEDNKILEKKSLVQASAKSFSMQCSLLDRSNKENICVVQRVVLKPNVQQDQATHALFDLKKETRQAPIVTQPIFLGPDCAASGTETSTMFGRTDGAWTYIIFDLETTGLGSNAEIVQIAAICGHQRFSRYVMPQARMSRGASMVTGICVFKKNMYVNKHKVNAVSPWQAFNDFIDFLKRFPKPMALVSHNCLLFDSRVLVRSLQRLNLIELFSIVCNNFLDTLPIFREAYPGMESYKQEYLAQTLLDEQYAAHNACNDVRILQMLFNRKLSEVKVQERVFSIENVLEFIGKSTESKVNLQSFRKLIDAGVISQSMASKMATTGLGYDTLEKRFSTDGRPGLSHLLVGDNVLKPIVTKSKKILNNVSEYFEQLSIEEKTQVNSRYDCTLWK